MGGTAELSAYAAEASFDQLPREVVTRARQVILDSFGAMLAGTRLKPGRLIGEFARQLPTGECTVVGSRRKASPMDAALVNATLTHADETDDSHFSSVSHPAATCLPPALAMAERVGANGRTLIGALVVGYDVQCRASLAINPVPLQARGFTSLAISGNFGAAAAAGKALGLDAEQMRDALGLVGCHAVGLWACAAEPEHCARSLTAGVPARNGTMAALLAGLGFHGPPAIFEGRDGIFKAYADGSSLGELTRELGRRYEIMGTSIKKHSCGGPIRGPVDALLKLMAKHDLSAHEIDTITVRLASTPASVMDDREDLSINLQYVMAVAAIDARVDVEQTHSEERTRDPEVLKLKERVTLIPDAELEKLWPKVRPGIAEVATRDGRRYVERVDHPEGSPQNPLTEAQVEAKFLRLSSPIIGRERAEELVCLVGRLEQVESLEPIARLLMGS